MVDIIKHHVRQQSEVKLISKYISVTVGEWTLESVSPVARIPRKAVGPMYIRRVIPEHVKDPRAPVDKSRVHCINSRRHWSDTRITKNSCKAT